MIAGLKPYPAMKPSGVDWLGAMPDHWGLERLGSLLHERRETNKDGSVTSVLSVLRKRGVIPYEEKGNIGNKKSDDITRYKIVRPNDIVVNCMNVIIGSVGLSSYTGCLSPVYYVLVARGNDVPEYLNAIFQTRAFHRSLVRIGNGILAHRMRIPMELLKCELLPRPPLPEQAAIVRYLDHVDRRISRYIRAKQRLVELLEEEKQVVIHRAVTRGLDPDVPLKPSGVEWLGDVPKHWEVARLAETAALVNGFPFDSELFDPSNGTPLVRIRDLFEEKTAVRWSGDPTPEASIADGDVLIGMDGDFNVAWWEHGPALLNQRLCCIRALPSRASQRYLFYCLRFPLTALNEVTYATTVKHLSSLDVLKFRLPIPPLPEQAAIVRYLDEITADIDTAIDTTRRETELLNEYRTRLIADVVTGKLDVREAAAHLPEFAPVDLEDTIQIDDVVPEEFSPELEEVAT